MLRCIAAMAAYSTLALAGCHQPDDKTYAVDLSNAWTSVGYINSGLHTLGELYLLDQQAKTLTKLRTISVPDSAKAKSEQGDTRDATGIKGFGLTAGGSFAEGTVRAEVKNDIESNLKISFVKYATEPLSNPAQFLIDYLNATLTPENRESNVSQLYLEECYREPTRYKLVLVSQLLRANQAQFEFAGATVAGGSVKIPTVAEGSIELKFNTSDLERTTGNQSAVTFQLAVLTVLKPVRNNVQLWDFRIDTVSTQSFTELLR